MSKGKARHVEPIYTSIGCNRYSNVADVRSDGLVAFGAGKLVALWHSEDTSKRGIHRTLAGHTGTVCVLKFLAVDNDKEEEEDLAQGFITGDTAGKCIIWRRRASQEQDFHQACTIQLPASVGAVASLRLPEGNHLIAVGTSDCRVAIYRTTAEGEMHVTQTIDTKEVMPMDIAMTWCPGSRGVILAVGGTDSKIRIYTSSSPEKAFLLSNTLPGHADWVRCLAFTGPLTAGTGAEHSGGDILLASGSQDLYIRLWRFSAPRTGIELHPSAPSTDPSSSTQRQSVLDILDALDDSADGEISAKQYPIKVEGGHELACSAESVLLGHDNWVTGLHWSRKSDGPPQLLSTSADRSMILWKHDPASSVWLTSQRFGEIGGTNLGFFGGLWGKDDATVVAHGWGGSFHCWRQQQEGIAPSSLSPAAAWQAVVAPTGHFADATSLAWEPEGDYLVSVSDDQTARLHAPWKRSALETWHELGRPQIHGYDMTDVAFLSRTRLISGSEEKIVRVFDAPAVFVASMRQLGATGTLQDDGSRPNAATVPALGLSNKAVFGDQGQSELNGTASGSKDTITFHALKQPPTEEQLLTSTLWPETEKLYGHGYELNAIAASSDGKLVVSACRATTAEHAVLRMHRTDTWAIVQPPLAGHNLTVTRIAFSPDDVHILSVSRDRSWQLYQRQSDYSYEKVAQGLKSHARIIWDAAWSSDGTFFVTASRDKQVKIWARDAHDKTKWAAVATIAVGEAATAVAVTQCGYMYILAIGCESGHVQFHAAQMANIHEWESLDVCGGDLHVATVSRLAWRPAPPDGPARELTLASCSEDRSVRVVKVIL